MSIFGSEKIISERISKADLKTYIIGLDLGEFRYDDFIDILLDVIVDFAFGYHDGKITTNYNRRKLKEAAKSIYNIKEYTDVKEIYIDNNSFIPDDDDCPELRRGEFGELILHLILRDFHNTIPLLSKIFFKDSDGAIVHGFDAVHINPDQKTIWLGESKIYHDGKKGVKALCEDIKGHFLKDYLRREFALISKKKECYKNKEDIQNYEYWYEKIDEKNKLQDILNGVTIPLLCTYSSSCFDGCRDEKEKKFIDAHKEETKKLKEYFDNNLHIPIETDLNIILLLLPVPEKKELVKRLHQKIENIQNI